MSSAIKHICWCMVQHQGSSGAAPYDPGGSREKSKRPIPQECQALLSTSAGAWSSVRGPLAPPPTARGGSREEKQASCGLDCFGAIQPQCPVASHSPTTGTVSYSAVGSERGSHGEEQANNIPSEDTAGPAGRS
ncbi:hypothetical protein NDU88_007096 [Pleurodeles waltl]|uniref:Uncharacterized protein n=1 Tax=Pleurodeles waltl TaxID=8319 RepID=A0AAV7VPR4_PLEWA|nr:hypothetical protein NDU88_007096 [Pleurodeles waltl]